MLVNIAKDPLNLRTPLPKVYPSKNISCAERPFEQCLIGHRMLFAAHFFLYNKSEKKTCNKFLLNTPPLFYQHLEKHLKYYDNPSSFPRSGSWDYMCVSENLIAEVYSKKRWFSEGTRHRRRRDGGEGRILCDRWKGAQAQAQAAPLMGRRGVEDAENPPRLPQTTVASTSRRLHWWVDVGMAACYVANMKLKRTCKHQIYILLSNVRRQIFCNNGNAVKMLMFVKLGANWITLSLQVKAIFEPRLKWLGLVANKLES